MSVPQAHCSIPEDDAQRGRADEVNLKRGCQYFRAEIRASQFHSANKQKLKGNRQQITAHMCINAHTHHLQLEDILITIFVIICNACWPKLTPFPGPSPLTNLTVIRKSIFSALAQSLDLFPCPWGKLGSQYLCFQMGIPTCFPYSNILWHKDIMTSSECIQVT